MQEFISIVPCRGIAGQYFSFSLAFCASKSFHHSFVELVDKFKEKLKIGAPLDPQYSSVVPDSIEHVNCE